MRGPKPTKIELSDDERWQLEHVSSQAAALQPIALRAQIVLAAASGMNNCQIARQLQVSLDMVRRWRKRWHTLQLLAWDNLPITERLSDAPRSGKLRHLTAALEYHPTAQSGEESRSDITHLANRDGYCVIPDEEPLLEREVAG